MSRALDRKSDQISEFSSSTVWPVSTSTESLPLRIVAAPSDCFY